MIDDSSWKIEYKLSMDFPNIGGSDTISTTLDLNSSPGIESIIFSFYRFLLTIGIDKKNIEKFISLSKLNDSIDEDENNNGDEDLYFLDDIFEKNISDDLKKKSFLEKLQESPEFLQTVFKTFVSSLLDEDENFD